MSNLKDTDIDDLFRRASDKYPLRTDSADWDKMAAALDKDLTPAGFEGTGADDKRRKRRFFWLLLFLPLGGAGYYTWVHAGHGSSHPAMAVVAAPGNRQSSSGPENISQKTGQGDPVAATSIEIGESGADGQQKTGSKGTQGEHTGAGKRPAGGNGPDGTAVGAGGRKRPAGGAAGEKRFASSSLGGNRQTDEFADGKMFASTSGATPTYIATQPFSLKWAEDMQRARIANDYRLSVDVTAPPATRNTDTVVKPKKSKTSYLYAGIIGAPDISTVKMQSVKGVGTTFGILFGYAFDSRWSIETGAYVDRKKYYSDGEYFDKKALDLYPGQTLLNVDGTCYMWEIPLNVRYTFNPAAKTKWFATTGFSTYLMSKENYTYAYKRYGWTGQGVLNNTKPSQYPFSIVNLSAGFEQRLGRVGNLRVEPYVRLPLGGIGTGKLPIMSTGVNIGITRRLW